MPTEEILQPKRKVVVRLERSSSLHSVGFRADELDDVNAALAETNGHNGSAKKKSRIRIRRE